VGHNDAYFKYYNSISLREINSLTAEDIRKYSPEPSLATLSPEYKKKLFIEKKFRLPGTTIYKTRAEMTDEEIELVKKCMIAVKKKMALERAKLEHEAKEKKNEIEKYEKANKLLFFNHPRKGYLGRNGKWEYNPIQKQIFTAIRQFFYKTIVMTGGNRISKTFTGFCLMLSCIKGCFPWEDERIVGRWVWEKYGWTDDLPIKGRIVGQDWEKHIKTTIEPKFDELLPDSWESKCKKNSLGVRAYWEFYENKALIGTAEVLSNKSDSEVFEGADTHFILYDEPPNRNNRIAAARGLVDHNGIEIFCMTLLKEAWVNKEVVNAVDEDGEPRADVLAVNGESWDNVGYGISEEGLKDYIDKLTDDEKDARIRGIPSYLSGIILKIDNKTHLKRLGPKDIMRHWMIDVAIDWHPAKKQYICMLATDDRNYKYFCHSIVGNGDGYWIADQILKSVDRYSLRINRIIADPLSKTGEKSLNIAIKSEFQKMEERLGEFGYELESAAPLKSMKSDGIIQINELLSTPNGIPALFFFKTQNESQKNDCISQIQEWVYDDNGDPSKENDDACENLYRLVLLNTEYEEPEIIERYYDRHKNENYEQEPVRSSVTGY